MIPNSYAVRRILFLCGAFTVGARAYLQESDKITLAQYSSLALALNIASEEQDIASQLLANTGIHNSNVSIEGHVCLLFEHELKQHEREKEPPLVMVLNNLLDIDILSNTPNNPLTIENGTQLAVRIIERAKERASHEDGENVILSQNDRDAISDACAHIQYGEQKTALEGCLIFLQIYYALVEEKKELNPLLWGLCNKLQLISNEPVNLYGKITAYALSNYWNHALAAKKCLHILITHKNDPTSLVALLPPEILHIILQYALGSHGIEQNIITTNESNSITNRESIDFLKNQFRLYNNYNWSTRRKKSVDNTIYMMKLGDSHSPTYRNLFCPDNEDDYFVLKAQKEQERWGSPGRMSGYFFDGIYTSEDKTEDFFSRVSFDVDMDDNSD